jgi:hypothetical protein
MSDPLPSPAAIPIASKRWVEIPSGETLCVDSVQGETVEGYRMLKNGKRIRFTGSVKAWLRIVAKYGGF